MKITLDMLPQPNVPNKNGIIFDADALKTAMDKYMLLLSRITVQLFILVSQKLEMVINVHLRMQLVSLNQLRLIPLRIHMWHLCD